MKVRAKTIDPWARPGNEVMFLRNTMPKTKATISISPADAMHVARGLFWLALRGRIKGRDSVTFSLEDDGR